MAKFRIPEHPEQYIDHDYVIKDPSLVDEDVRFNEA